MSSDCDEVTGVCARVDAVTNIEQLVELAGFRSPLAKMLFGLLMIVGFTVGGIILGAKEGGTIAAIIGGIVGFGASLLASVLIFGWLGIWILFFFIFVIISVVVVTLYWKSGV